MGAYKTLLLCHVESHKVGIIMLVVVLIFLLSVRVFSVSLNEGNCDLESIFAPGRPSLCRPRSRTPRPTMMRLHTFLSGSGGQAAACAKRCMTASPAVLLGAYSILMLCVKRAGPAGDRQGEC